LAYHDMVLDDGWGPAFKWFLGLSIIFHVGVLYFGLTVLPNIKPARKVEPLVYTVNLVTGLPAPPAVSPAPASDKQADLAPAERASEPESGPESETSTEPLPEPEDKSIPLPPIKPLDTELEPLKELKPPPKVEPEPAPLPAKVEPLRPITPKEPVKPAVKKIRKPPKPTPKTDPNRTIDQALAKIRSRVQREKRATSTGQDQKQIDQAIASLAAKISDQGEGDSVMQMGARGTGPITELDSQTREYLIIMYNIITANLRMPPESLVDKKKKLKAIYVVRINRSGKIIKAWFEKESGQKNFDMAVEQALKRSDPFPPLYEAIPDPLEVGWVFDPSGVKTK